ncbi:hypothetical protein H310_00388 [Aphanomyces invadans]|uniref:UDP-glycosyltransferases domain-containing protein n=1 Tax=Aphanomyces invadans TaxID=157072 RepID=A0A024UVN0_9STRA|nr:hypothetical protein H310_00388 [Aphanomyces invadans]ETW09972.1 hypothetical protein H310_00388 [Aphanomyces invadans]|eukprot:XP_008861383.1 hypothetical protein H310_00388 [Aphanomyces invadans]
MNPITESASPPLAAVAMAASVPNVAVPVERGITQVRVQPKSSCHHEKQAMRGVEWNGGLPVAIVAQPIGTASCTITSGRSSIFKQCFFMLVLLFVVTYVLGEHIAAIGLPTTVAASFQTSATSTSAVYVSMVSIPVMERVLPLKHLAEELLQRGYRVSVAMPEICRSWVSDVPGLEFISLGTMSVSSHPLTIKTAVGNVGVHSSYLSSLQHYASYHQPMLHPLLEDFTEDPPSIIVVDRYSFAGMDVGASLGIPCVINNPFLLLDIDDPPAYVPAPLSHHPIMDAMTVYQRCMNGYFRLRFRLLNLGLAAHLHDATGSSVASKILSNNVNVVLTNSAFGLEYPRPLTPLHRMVGALRRRAVTPMDADLESWFNISPRETDPYYVVYVDFGPDVVLSMEVMTQIITVLRELDLRVVWKLTADMHKAWNTDDDDAAPLLHAFESWEVYFSPRIAHTAVLHHAAFFVTAGGFNHAQEALCAGRPILGIPFSAEQAEFVDRVIRAGAGVSIEATELTVENLRHAAQLLLAHDRFAKAATRLGGLLTSAGGVVEAANIVLAVADRGALALIPARHTQPFVKTYLFDVYAVYGAVLCGVAVILRTLLSALFSVFQRKTVPLAPDVPKLD